jgi:hypothetical protein
VLLVLWFGWNLRIKRQKCYNERLSQNQSKQWEIYAIFRESNFGTKFSKKKLIEIIAQISLFTSCEDFKLYKET